MSIFISVIIPVYNAEMYLEECIESLRNQSLKEIEMIFVNDGSTDKSLDILNKYKEIDKRIKIINQSNKGPSAARNLGIINSKGKYLSFVDADDWIDVDMYKEMYDVTVKSNKLVDIVVSDIIIYKSRDNYKYSRELDLEEGLYGYKLIREKIIPKFFKNSSFNSMANKIFRGEIIRSNNILLDESLYYAEDWKFNVEFFKYLKTLYYINKPFYYYRRGHNSSSCEYNENTFNHNGVVLYNNRKAYSGYFNIDKYEGANELLNIMRHCILMEVLKKNVSKREKIKRINDIISKEEVNEAIEHVNKKNISIKEKFIYIVTQRKKSKLMYIYSLIVAMRCKR